MKKHFEPLRFIIPNMLPVGVTLLAGEPKSCKSFLALSISLAVATGGIALGHYKMETAGVLHISLEDSERRLQSRAEMMLPEGVELGDNIHFIDEPIAGNLYERIKLLDEFLDAHADVKLVVIDTLPIFKMSDQEPYSKDDGGYKAALQAVRPLVEFAKRRDVAMLLITHKNKSDNEERSLVNQVHGSIGLAGTADTIWGLVKRKDGTGTLTITGRDVESKDVNLRLSPNMVWTEIDEGQFTAKTKERQAIISVLEAAGRPMTSKEICDKAKGSGNADSVRALLRAMKSDGDLLQLVARGPYELPPCEGTKVTLLTKDQEAA